MTISSGIQRIRPERDDAILSLRRHRIDSSRYHSPAFFEAEWSGMWTKVWLLLGRATDMPEAGDYQVEEVGPESIAMVRQEDGAINAFYNVCQHRGARLLPSGDGSQASLTCPYHGWRYGIDGRLESAPDAETFPSDNLCAHVRLAEIRCEVFAGFVWVNMDPDCGSLRDYLGPVWDAWEEFPIAGMKRYAATSVRMPCNWKVIHDNFSESYHVQVLHGQAKWFVDDGYAATRELAYPEGHGLAHIKGNCLAGKLIGGEGSALLADCPEAEWLRSTLRRWELDPHALVGQEDKIRSVMQKQKRKLGPERGYDYFTALRDDQLTDFYHYQIFPNIAASITAEGFHFMRYRPIGRDPGRCLFDNWFYGVEPPAGDVDRIVVTPQGLVDADHPLDYVAFDYGEQSLGQTIDQDCSIMVAQQEGLQSRGFAGPIFSSQEGRIPHYHRVIDEYISGVRGA